MIVLPLLPFYAMRAACDARDRRPADRVVLDRPAAVGAALGPGVRPVRPPARAADRARRLGGGLRGVRTGRRGVAAVRLPRGPGRGRRHHRRGPGLRGRHRRARRPGARARLALRRRPPPASSWAPPSAPSLHAPRPGGPGPGGGGALPGERALRLEVAPRIARSRGTPSSPPRQPIWHPAWLVDAAPDRPGRAPDLDLRRSGWSPSRP